MSPAPSLGAASTADLCASVSLTRASPVVSLGGLEGLVGRVAEKRRGSAR